jgi:hypothetical protein
MKFHHQRQQLSTCIILVLREVKFLACLALQRNYYVSPHFGGETYCFRPVRLSVTQFVSATPLKLLNIIS